MEWEKHIGRVGALAVALGIGSAVVAMPAVSWGQTEESSSAGVAKSDARDAGTDTDGAGESTSSGTDDGEASPSATPDFDSPAGDSDVADSPSEDPEDDAPIDDPGSESIDESVDVRSHSDHEESGDRPTTATDEQSYREVNANGTDYAEVEVSSLDDLDTDDTAKPSPTQRTADTEQPDSAVEPGVTDPAIVVPASPALNTSKPTTVTTSLAAPAATASDPDEPPAPAASPLLLTLLASAWRSVTDRIDAAQSASAVTSAAAPGDIGVSATSAPIRGGASQSPVIADDGTIYQVTDGGGTTRVSILDSDGQVITTSEFDGVGTRAQAAARPDGSLIVVTASEDRWSTTVRAVDSDGNVTRLATVFGLADSPLTVGADGALYFKTVIRPLADDLPAIDYRFVRVSANNFTRTYSYDTEFELASDGTAYLVSSRFGFSTLRTIYSSGWTRASLLPFGSDPSAPLMDQDGTVYVAAGVQGLFGSKSTRVYTIEGASRTVRSIVGLPGEMVMLADGFGLETVTFDGYTDEGTGTTYISTVTADALVTSEAIDGRIAGLQVGANGTAYAPIVDPARDDTAVAVVDPDGEVVLVVVPGMVVVRDRGDRLVRGGSAQSNDDFGYVNYTADGTEYVAVLAPDATVARTIELPEGAHGTVFFGPDGSAFQLLEYYGPSVSEPGRQILALTTGAFTAFVPGDSAVDDADVVFGPDGTGYLLAHVRPEYETSILGFNAAGDTVIPLSSITSPALGTNADGDTIILVFGPDGTAYVVDRSQANSGVYALTASGLQKLVDLEYSQLGDPRLPTFGADGTGYVANTVYLDGGIFETSVTSFGPTVSI